MRFCLKFGLLASIAAVFLTGCGGGGDTVFSGSATETVWNFVYPPSGNTAVPIKQLVNGLDGGQSIGFSLGVHYVADFDPGNPQLLVQVQDQASNALIDSANLTPVQDGHYTAFALGRETSSAKVLLFTNSPAPVSGNVGYRYLHADPIVGPVDLYLLNATATQTTDIKAGVTLGQFGTSVTAPAGNYLVSVTAPGVAPNGSTDLARSPVTLTAGRNYFLVVSRNSPGSALVVKAIAER